jgi:ankyrin
MQREQTLFQAIKTGDLQQLRQTLSSNTNLEALNRVGENPLTFSTQLNNEGALRLLLSQRINPNQVNHQGDTALMMAARSGKANLVKLLLNAPGIKTDQSNLIQQTALHIAAANGHLPIVSLLMEAEANPNMKDIYGLTPLHLAAEQGHLEVVQQLCKQTLSGSSIAMSPKDRFGNTPLNLAIHAKRLEVASALIALKGFPTCAEVFCAVEGDDLETLEYLIQNTSNNRHAGGDILECRNHQGHTPLMVAVAWGNLRIVETLIKYGSNANSVDHCGWNSLFHAVFRSFPSPAIHHLLLDSGADVHIHSKNGYNLLHAAVRAKYPHTHTIHLLKDLQVNLNHQNTKGQTPLMIATERGHHHIIHQLLGFSDIDVDRVNNEGRSALFLAVIHGYTSVVQTLLNHGANPYLTDMHGFDVHHYAKEFKQHEVIKILKAHV